MRGLPTAMKHVLSHRVIYAKFYELEVVKTAEPRNSVPPIADVAPYILVKEEDLGRYAVSRLIERYMEKCLNF
ncbi:hypothetical protein FACS1894199_19110 [Bacteroidia bacterium]|nr:hypothetical protein FACS1894199_19110 [Bacteroidia bacterium]